MSKENSPILTMVHRLDHPSPTPSSTTYLAIQQTSYASNITSRKETGNPVLTSETFVSISQDQAHDLRGIGAQFQGRGLPPQRVAFSHTATATSTCPYHQTIFESKDRQETSASRPDGLSSYLYKDPAKQYALYCIPGTGTLSTTRNCNCTQQRG